MHRVSKSYPGMFVYVFVTAMLVSCSSLTPEPPPGYDLSGQWQLLAALSDQPNLRALGRGTEDRSRGARGQNRGGQQGRGQRSGKSGGQGRGPQDAGQGKSSQGGSGAINRHRSVGAQVLTAIKMSIEQDSESMGVDYDGNNYRDVSWGERQRGNLKINAGWEEDNLMIRTEGSRFPVEETYILSDGGSRLTVFVELDGGSNDMVFKRVFKRADIAKSET